MKIISEQLTQTGFFATWLLYDFVGCLHGLKELSSVPNADVDPELEKHHSILAMHAMRCVHLSNGQSSTKLQGQQISHCSFAFARSNLAKIPKHQNSVPNVFHEFLFLGVNMGGVKLPTVTLAMLDCCRYKYSVSDSRLGTLLSLLNCRNSRNQAILAPLRVGSEQNLAVAKLLRKLGNVDHCNSHVLLANCMKSHYQTL